MWSVATVADGRQNLDLPKTTNVTESRHRKINGLVSPNPRNLKEL